MRKRTAESAPVSAARLAEIDAVIADLVARQAAQPRGEFVRRARLALLIEAFMRRRALLEAELRNDV